MSEWFGLFWALNIILESLPLSSSGHAKIILYFHNLFSKDKVTISESQYHLMHYPNAIIVSIFVLQIWGYLLYDFSKYITEIGLLTLYVLVTTLTTIVFYFVLKKYKIYFPLFLGFIITSLSLLSLQFISSYNSSLSFKHAIFIGVVQGVSLLPGISRMASTYVCGRWLGLDHQTSFAFSCAIEVPILIAAVFRALFLKIDGIFFPKYNNALILISSLFSYFLLVVIYRSSDLTMVSFGYYMIIPILFSIYLRKDLKEE